jgi:hypothetical protein
MTSVFQQLIAIPDQIERLKLAIIDMIDNMPENPRIKRIGGNCFTISSKDLSSNWTPFFHDFRMQAEHIQMRICGMESQFIIGYLKQIVEKQTDYYQKYNYKFNPIFCDHLKTLITLYGGKED